jgi:GAF domain-containing protein
MLTNWFSDPEDANPSFLRLTRNILILSIVANFAILVLISGIFFKSAENRSSSIAFTLTLILEIISLVFTLRGSPLLAKIVVPTALVTAVTFSAISANGLHDLSMLGFPTVIVVSVLLLRKRSIYIATPLAVAGVEIVAISDMLGFTNSTMAEKTDITDALIAAVLVIAVSALLQLLVSRLNDSLNESRRNEIAQAEAIFELRTLKQNLENRIAERTRELTEAISISERRASNFEAAAQLARTVANVREIGILLPTIAGVIGEKFNYEHVEIYLNDNEQEYTVLVAANSENGKKLLEQGHQLRTDQPGLVSTVAKSGAIRITNDTQTGFRMDGSQEVTMGSEAALPLKVGNTVVGVIDIHTGKTNAFDETAIGILSILTDQVAIAVQNARIYNETQATLAESQILYGSVIQQSWKRNIKSDLHLGYKFTGTSVSELDQPLSSIELVKALETGEIVSSPHPDVQGGKVIAVPLKLRGEVIGAINVKMPTGADLGQDESDIIRSTAERVALALENSTLLEESQRRASREQTIGQISTRIGAATEIEAILKTAVRELGTQIGGAQVTVEIGSGHE